MTVMSLPSPGLRRCRRFMAAARSAELGLCAAVGTAACLLHLSLVRSYRVGDLGQIYPISRGSSHALIALGAALFAGEALTAGELLGIGLVSGGDYLTAFRGRSCPCQAFLMRWERAVSSQPTASSRHWRQAFRAPLAYTVWIVHFGGCVAASGLYRPARRPQSVFRSARNAGRCGRRTRLFARLRNRLYRNE